MVNLIIDVHRHWSPPVPDDAPKNIKRWEKALRKGTAMLCANMAARYGINKPLKEVISILETEMDDPDGEMMLKRMDEFGIDVSVVCFVDNESWDDKYLLNVCKQLSNIADRDPKRIVPFAGINPGRGEEVLPTAVEEYGIKGIKWHPDTHYFMPNDETAYNMLKVVEDLNVPLLTHTGHIPFPAKAKFAHPKHYDEILVDFPKIKIIAAHMGFRWWREWSAIAEFKANFYGDLAMWQFWAKTSYNKFCHILREIIDIAGVDRIMFGTDSPTLDLFVPIPEWIKILKDLPEKAPEGINFKKGEIDAILGNNAQKVLGLL